MNISSEQLHTLYQKLSPEMRSVEFTERASGAIRASSEKNKLSPEQTRVFAETIWKTIVGALPREKIADELAVRLSLQPEQARAVAREVEREIFAKVGGSVSPPLLRGSTPSGARGEVVVSLQNTPPRPAFGGPPLLNQGGDERKVPIRKPAPPPPLLRSILRSRATAEDGQGYAGQVPTTHSLQTILADIRRGTAYDEKRIEDAFRKTPIEVRQTLESVGFLSRLENIAKKFGLNVEETGELVSESGLVMLGLTLPVQFVDNLGKRLRLPRDRAMAVGQAVNMEVLRPVREILRKMTDTNIRMDTNLQMSTNKTENQYRFAPTTQPTPKNPPAVPTLPANLPTTPVVGKYTTDPYREPIE